MPQTILILRWPGSAYDSLGGLLDMMSREFVALGFETKLFSADGADWPARLQNTLKRGGIAFALTMSGIGTDVMLDGKLIWETLQVPLFNWNCDHPCYFPPRHALRSPYLLHGYVFPDHARYNIEHLHPNGLAFAVHLGIPPRDVFPRINPPRNGRILFAKSGTDLRIIENRWRQELSAVQHILFAASEEVDARSTGEFLPLLQNIAEAHGVFLAADNHLTMVLLRELDAYIRFKRGNALMNSILPFPVDVLGSGWEHINWKGANARLHGPIGWRAMITRLPHYTGCLSINPLIHGSAHDRVFFALAAGVPPLGDANDFTRTQMPELERYSFDFTKGSIEAAIAALLDDPADAIARTEATWQALAVPYGMRRAADQIVRFVALQGLNGVLGPA